MSITLQWKTIHPRLFSQHKMVLIGLPKKKKDTELGERRIVWIFEELGERTEYDQSPSTKFSKKKAIYLFSRDE